MELGFIGLGKMGMNMVTRLRRDQHRVVVYDRSNDLIKQAYDTAAPDEGDDPANLYAKLGIPGRSEGHETEFNQRCRAVYLSNRRGLINQSELDDWEAKLSEGAPT